MDVRYHLNNRVETFKLVNIISMTTLVVAAMLTIWIVVNSYTRVKEGQHDTYVYSRNGAAIHVFVKKK
jgi:hypothetical protein